MARQEGEINGGAGGSEHVSAAQFSVALAGLESAVLSACAREQEWPAQVAAGVYAGVDFAIDNPAVARSLTFDFTAQSDCKSRYEQVIGRLAGYLKVKAPVGSRSLASTDEALVAGVVGLVGDHVRIGRVDRLAELRPELVLLTLLPYLGFSEAKRWADETADARPD